MEHEVNEMYGYSLGPYLDYMGAVSYYIDRNGEFQYRYMAFETYEAYYEWFHSMKDAG